MSTTKRTKRWKVTFDVDDTPKKTDGENFLTKAEIRSEVLDYVHSSTGIEIRNIRITEAKDVR